MNTDTPWPGLSAIIHHTLHRHTLITLDEAARRCNLPTDQLCRWAKENGIPLYVTTAGFCIEAAAIASALARRSMASRIAALRTYRQ